jgi:hypothetical protein
MTIEELTKNQRRYLRRKVCGLCDMPLSEDSCGSIYGPACTKEFLKDRRTRCLLEYKPRQPVNG